MTVIERRRGPGTYGLGGLAVPAAALLLLVGCASSHAGAHDRGAVGRASESRSASASPSNSVEVSSGTYLGLPVEPVGSAHVLADHAAAGMLLAQPTTNRLWVGGAEGLWWVDRGDESVHQVDTKPGVGIFARGGSLYRAAYYGGDVARYDVAGPRTRETARVKATAPLYGVANRDGVWVSDHTGGRLVQLDPVTLARRATLQLGPRSGGYHHALAGLALVGAHDLWVVSERDQRLYHVDTRSARIAGHIDLDARPTDQVVPTGGGLLIVMLSRAENPQHADLEVVDTNSRQVVAQVVTHDKAFPTPEAAEQLGANPVVIGGQVWVPADEHLLHLDPANGWKPDRVLALPARGLLARFATVGFGSLWVYGDAPEPTIVRVPLADLT
jgi:hypothetical protein